MNSFHSQWSQYGGFDVINFRHITSRLPFLIYPTYKIRYVCDTDVRTLDLHTSFTAAHYQQSLLLLIKQKKTKTECPF